MRQRATRRRGRRKRLCRMIARWVYHECDAQAERTAVLCCTVRVAADLRFSSENLSLGALLLVLDRRVEADAWLSRPLNIAPASGGAHGLVHAHTLIGQRTLLGTATHRAAHVSDARALAGWSRVWPSMVTSDKGDVGLGRTGRRGARLSVQSRTTERKRRCKRAAVGQVEASDMC